MAHRIATALLHTASMLVPRTLRVRFMREWNAEFSAVDGRSAREQLRLILRSLGVFPDAVSVRRHLGRDRGKNTSDGRGGVMWDDFRYAMRSVGKAPMSSFVAGLTLALGIGSATAIYSTFESVVQNPVPYHGADRLVTIVRSVEAGFVFPTRAQVDAWARQRDLVEELELWSVTGMTLTDRGDTRAVQVARVRPSMHEFLRRHPRLGRTFDATEVAGDGAEVVILSEAFWRREFGGDPTALGGSLILDGKPHTIIGVLADDAAIPGWFALESVELPAEPLTRADMWAPLGESARLIAATARLTPGASVAQLNERIEQLTDQGIEPENNGRWSGTAVAMTELVGTETASSLRFLMYAVWFLVLIVCANVSNLMLFRASARRHTTALRAALGASFGRLLRQFRLRGVHPRRIRFRGRAPVGAGSAGGHQCYPSRDSRRAGRSLAERPCLRIRRRGRLGMVETALAFSLVVGAFSIANKIGSLQRTDLGFETENLLELRVTFPAWRYDSPRDRVQSALGVSEALAATPGIAGVARSTGLPPTSGLMFAGQLSVEGQSEPVELSLYGPDVDASYFATIGQELIDGRPFSSDEVENERPVLILGASTADRLFPGGAVGRSVRFGERPTEILIVGVARDVPMSGLNVDAPLQAYRPIRATRAYNSFAIRLESGVDAADMVQVVRSRLQDLDGDLQIDRLGFAVDLMASSLARERFTGSILLLFSTMALVLAAVGLYGVMAEAVTRRTREIGIRMALGADRASIVGIVVLSAMSAVGGGIALGAVLTLAVEGLIPTQLLAEGRQPWGHLTAAGVLCLVGLSAALLPALRASRVQPDFAIRME